MLAFYRDRQVQGCTSVEQRPGIAVVSDAVSAAMGVTWANRNPENAAPSLQPPYGTLPVKGLVMLAAPLCYLFEHPAAVHRLFRSMYCRHWCKLHSLSPLAGHGPALPVLLKTYEQLLQASRRPGGKKGTPLPDPCVLRPD